MSFEDNVEEIDLWADDEEDIFEPAVSKETSEVEGQPELLAKEPPTLEGFTLSLAISGESIVFRTHQELPEAGDFNSLLGLLTEEHQDYFQHTIRLSPLNAFVLRFALKSMRVNINPEDGLALKELADKVPMPQAKLASDGKSLAVRIPNLKLYRELMNKVNGYPKEDFYRVQIVRAFDLEALSKTLHTNLPRIKFSEDVLKINSEPIPNFDGTLESLKSIPVGVLNAVTANSQTWKALKNSKETLEEKLEKYGVKNLHDLLFRLPRRYIDKSNPQDVRDLIEGESATIVGKIRESDSIPGATGGTAFMVEDQTGNSIRVAFWRQHWLRTKYKVGDEVLITGTFSWWMRKPQLGGVSIDLAEDVAILPIVPVYRQSEAKGLTTYLFMAAVRELLSRLGPISLPAYFKQAGRMDYHQALRELHFPSSLEQHKIAVETLAYYELVYMQVIIQESKANTEARPGISLAETPRRLQTSAIKSLPFQLTKDQKKAVVKLNESLDGSIPTTSLLVADVGAGKTVVAQLAALKAVDAGYQAVLIGPTDVLARQLYSTLQRLTEGLFNSTGEEVKVVFLGGSMKAKERKTLLAEIESGEAAIIVGTQAVFSETVKYANLGMVCIDEQQKFGAEQRTKLLNSREDGRVPDLLLQTATPIPRTTAQIVYGDIDIIEIHEKPAGRLPIITEWLEEDPQETITQAISPLWTKVTEEAAQGNQIFVITPMVVDSGKVDSASVERTFKMLSESTLPGLRVGFAHGQMKGDAQKEAMAKFRNKEYDVLVASTVVEVGVDIPDATVVVVLSADRLGASSLHQIRGRAGRNSKQSYCYLVSKGNTEVSRKRLQALVDSENGFDIAKIDLASRGEGKMFSSEQSGRSEMIFANLAKHAHRIEEAKEEAQRILASRLKGLALKDAREKFESDERLF